MKKFEYLRLPGKIVTDSSGTAISQARLNALGMKGWELVTFTFTDRNRLAFAYFVREKIEDESA